MIGASQINRRLLRRFPARRILDAALSVNAVASLLLTACAVPMTATMAACGVLGWCAVVGLPRLQAGGGP